LHATRSDRCDAGGAVPYFVLIAGLHNAAHRRLTVVRLVVDTLIP